VAIGLGASPSDITGENNTIVGTFALYRSTSASSNTGIGYGVLGQDTTGNWNDAFGDSALLHNTIGYNNNAVGGDALTTNTTGYDNSALGDTADVLSDNLNNATAIGADTQVGSSDTIDLGFSQANGNNDDVGIGTSFVAPSDDLTVSPTTYGTNGSAGATTTITQAGGSGTVTGVGGTAFTSGMVGGTIFYSNGTTGTITAVGSGTSLTSSNTTGGWTTATYNIVWGGFNVSTTGTTLIQPTTNSASAFQIQNNTGSTLLNVDTINSTEALTSTSTSTSLLTVTNNSALTNTISSISDTGVLTTTGNLLTLTAGAATTTTGLLTVNAAGLTTGYAENLNVNGAAVLTSGGAINVVGPTTTAAISANGGLLKVSAAGAFTTTAGAGSGGLLDLQANATLTGTLASISDTAIMTTTGNLLTLTANAATTATGLLTVNGTGLTAAGAAISISAGTTGAAIRIATGNIIDLASGVQGNTAVIKIPEATAACGSGTVQGLLFESSASTTQLGHACVNSAGTSLTFYAAAFTASSTDVAENYSDVDNDLAPGDLVALANDGTTYDIVKATAANQSDVIGVVSTSPGILLSGISEDGTTNLTNPTPVALSGRIPTNVSTENGPIAVGDYLTISSVSGVAMKATSPGLAIGRALEAYDGSGVGSIEVMTSVGYYAGPDTSSYVQNGGGASLTDLSASGDTTLANLNVSGPTTLNSLNVTNNASIQDDLSVGGSLTVTGLTTVTNLVVNGHIVTGGGQPTPQAQTAAGTGATVTVSGTDTIGTITINTGSHPTAGSIADILFSQAYGAAPHVILSPSNNNAAGLRYFKGNTTTNDFMFNVIDTPAANTTYQYDYIIGQ
jgi:hypothetical protein